MSTLSKFSEKDRQYFQYQARQEYLREQKTIQLELEQAASALEQARQREEAAREEAEIARRLQAVAREETEAAKQEAEEAQRREIAALTEIDRLKALLAEKSK